MLDRYGGARPRVLQAVLSHVLTLGAQTTVIEYRYLDPDWRSEHREFYATTFRRYPSVAHRLHFFAEAPSDELAIAGRPASFAGMTYLGYSTLRPVPAAPVGRTMLKPIIPGDLHCVAEDPVNLFGNKFTVRGAPFIAQDAQLSRCAQATTWVTAYYHYLKFAGTRILPGAIARAVANNLEHGRQVPSPGLTIGQMADAARSIGLPPLVYPLRNLAAEETIPRMVCRYLNSGIPVTIATPSHAFVLVGYGRSRDAAGKDQLHFIRHDDEVGPYRRVENWRLDEHGPWEFAIVPLPPKVYLPGENAEAIGAKRIQDELDRTPNAEARNLQARLLDAASPLTWRSTAVLSNEFKTTLEAQLYPPDVAAEYRQMQLSRFVWVVELTDRDLRDADEPCVLAEAVIDATDHVRDLHVLGWRVPGALRGWLPDEDVQTLMDGLPAMGPTMTIAQPRPWDV